MGTLLRLLLKSVIMELVGGLPRWLFDRYKRRPQPQRRDPVPQHDQDHQKLLDLGVPQHAIEAASRRGIGGGKILTLIGKLLPTIIDFLSENADKGGDQPSTPPPGSPPTFSPTARK